MENEIPKTVVDKLAYEENEELIKLMRDCKISDSVIMLTLFGIGTHTAYYKVLYNRINNNLDKMNDDYAKALALEIFHEIDKSKDDE